MSDNEPDPRRVPIWCDGRENGRWVGAHCLRKVDHPRHQVDPPPEPERPAWEMPPELEPYRALITNTGGNTVERLMEIYTLPTREGQGVMFSNMPLYLMAHMVGAQIALLRALHAQGLLPRFADVARVNLDRIYPGSVVE